MSGGCQGGDEAGYGLPDSDKPKAEITTGLLGHLTQPKPKRRIETLWDALEEQWSKAS